jgi:hypothetical protein
MTNEKQEGDSIPKIDIGDSIDELESLFDESSLTTGITPKLQPEIPVLNDIVDAAEAKKYLQAEAMAESNNAPADKDEDLQLVRLSKLMDTVDQKLSSELDPLVDILKDTIKDSIIDELKQQLKKEAAQTQSPPPAIDDPDKPFE